MVLSKDVPHDTIYDVTHPGPVPGIRNGIGQNGGLGGSFLPLLLVSPINFVGAYSCDSLDSSLDTPT